MTTFGTSPGKTFGLANRPALGALCIIVFGLASSAIGGPAQPVDYSEPKLLVGNIVASESQPKNLLFKSERKSTTNGAAVEVTCDYTYPDGSFAARDRIIYRTGRLVSFTEEELQTVEKGTVVIRPDPKKNGQQRLFFEYTVGQGSRAKTTSATEDLEPDTLVDDMIPAFLDSHWATIDQGIPAKFRYVVLSRKETVGFKLVKDSELSWHGKPAMVIKMEPTSFIIAQLVDPLVFVVEKAPSHRILQYTGRMTPMVKNGNKWKDLDAVCIFDWGQNLVSAKDLTSKPQVTQ